MKRSKPPKEDLNPKLKKKLKEIIKGLSKDWNADERETSILFDHSEKMVYLETSYPSTARRWFNNMWGDPKVKFDGNADTLKVKVPWEYCRRPDLILKKKHREYEG